MKHFSRKVSSTTYLWKDITTNKIVVEHHKIRSIMSYDARYKDVLTAEEIAAIEQSEDETVLGTLKALETGVKP